jgi:hypothetical protein
MNENLLDCPVIKFTDASSFLLGMSPLYLVLPNSRYRYLRCGHACLFSGIQLITLRLTSIYILRELSNFLRQDNLHPSKWFNLFGIISNLFQKIINQTLRGFLSRCITLFRKHRLHVKACFLFLGRPSILTIAARTGLVYGTPVLRGCNAIMLRPATDCNHHEQPGVDLSRDYCTGYPAFLYRFQALSIFSFLNDCRPVSVLPPGI